MFARTLVVLLMGGGIEVSRPERDRRRDFQDHELEGTIANWTTDPTGNRGWWMQVGKKVWGRMRQEGQVGHPLRGRVGCAGLIS